LFEISIRAALRAALVLFLAAAGLAIAPSVEARMREDRLWLIVGQTEHPIDIEIAATPEEQSRGLMFRTTLPANRGMLFPYPAAREITMWMKNTYISLDMVFIRSDGTIHRIEANTEPLSERIVASSGPASAVLELAAGTAAALGLKAGDKVRHPLFAAAER
jgi:hypothetical protein